MRITLDIEDDVLEAAKEIAARDRISIGHSITKLARTGLGAPRGRSGATPRLRGRFALLPKRGEVVTLAHVTKVLNDEGV